MNSESKRTRNIYLIILSIATSICIFIGLFSHLYKWFSLDTKKSVSIDNDSVVEQFDSIDLNLNVGDVSIEYGSDFHVNVEDYPEKIMPTWSVEDNTLIIKQNAKNISINWNDFKNVDCELAITVPAGTELKTIACDMDMGNLEINNVKAVSVALSADMGNIELEGANITTLAVKANMGSISADDSVITTAGFEADMGSIELEGQFSSIAAECNMGSIEIECANINDVKLDLHCDMGAIELNGKTVGSNYSN